MPDSTRGLAPDVTSGTVSSGDVVALGMGRIVSGPVPGPAGRAAPRAGVARPVREGAEPGTPGPATARRRGPRRTPPCACPDNEADLRGLGPARVRNTRLPVSDRGWQGARMTRIPTLTDGTVTLRAHREDDAEGAFEQCQDAVSQQCATVPLP